MTPIEHALSEIRHTIPPQVLEYGFLDNNWRKRRGIPLSVDHHIREKVISGRVLPNCNIKGGKEVRIDVSKLKPKVVDDYAYTYKVPKSLTDGCRIMSVLSVTYGVYPGRDAGSWQSYPSQQGSLVSTASLILESAATMPIFSSADCQIVGENTILLKGATPLPTNAVLVCQVEHTEMFSELSPRGYHLLSQMIIAAVKAYIYNNRIVVVDQATLHKGQTLGMLGNIIESYSEAEAEYQEILTTRWAKMVHSLDNGRMMKTVQLQIGAGL